MSNHECQNIHLAQGKPLGLSGVCCPIEDALDDHIIAHALDAPVLEINKHMT